MRLRLGKLKSPSLKIRQHERDKVSLFHGSIPSADRSRHGNNHRKEEMAIPVCDTPHAPFMFYENAPAFGFTNGIINLTLSANRTWLGSDGGVVNDQVVIGYAEIFWQPSACDRRSTMRCSWRHQRRKVRRINCHIHRRPLPVRHFARLSLGKGAA
jgi:hypothetical protein